MASSDSTRDATTLEFRISFPVAVSISPNAHDLLVEAAEIICADYVEANPDRVMWPAGIGAQMLTNPLALSDDEPIPFSDSVEVIDVAERERFDDEKRRRRMTQEWLPIATAPKSDQLIMAYCPPDDTFPDGRMMIWNAAILAKQDERTPNHLQFPATHWRPLPYPPRKAREASNV